MTRIDEVKKLINNSGNSFHTKVARWFSANGWQVTVSPYYMDQAQSKAREIDLVVEKLFPITEWPNQVNGYLAVRLFVECKYLASTSVFWFSDKDESAAMELVCSSGIFHKDNTFTNKHHYISADRKVAKLFCSDKANSVENEPFYKALNQVLNALVAMRETGYWSSEIKKYGNYIRRTLEYPLLVCNSFDRIYRVPFESEGDPEKVPTNFQLEVRYAYFNGQSSHRNEYFILDIVEFGRLPSFVTMIEQNAKVAIGFLSD